MGLTAKLHEVVSLRYQFWGPGPKGYTPIMTTLRTRDVVLRGSLIVDSTANLEGRFSGFSCQFFWDGTDRPGPTYRDDFDYPSSRAQEAAKEAVEYVRAGSMSFDPFFEELRQRTMESDADFVKIIRFNMGNVPVTAGRYWLKWKPRSAMVEDNLLLLARGESLASARLLAGHETVTDSSRGTWLLPKLPRGNSRRARA